MSDENEEMMLNLLDTGAAEIAGVDPNTGEILYTFTNKLKEVDPKLYKAINEAFYKDLMSLWEKGYISMDITQENPLVSLTQKAIDETAIGNLSKEEKSYLEELIKKLSK
jgi:hypothetical protein